MKTLKRNLTPGDHGKRCICTIRNRYIYDARIVLEDNQYFLVQNDEEGKRCVEKFGYKFSYALSDDKPNLDNIYVIHSIEEEEETLEEGDIVYVSDSDKNPNFKKRIFITKLKGEPEKYLCVKDGDEFKYKVGDEFSTTLWNYAKKVTKPKFEPVVIKLNRDYDAVIDEYNVQVGCQTIDFETILKVAEEVRKIKSNK